MSSFYIPGVSTEDLSEKWAQLCAHVMSRHHLHVTKRPIKALSFRHQGEIVRTQVGEKLWSREVLALCESLDPYVCVTPQTMEGEDAILIPRSAVVVVEYFT